MPSHNFEGNKVLMNYFGETEVSDNAGVIGEINEEASLDFFEIANTEEVFA
jgi:hypothetical protein